MAVTDQGDNVVIMGSKVALAQGIYDTILNVAAGASQQITITPPVGEVWRIGGLGLSILAPVGGTAGTHRITVYSGILDDRYRRMIGISNWGDVITMFYNTWSSATSSQGPPTADAQVSVVQGLVVSNAIPLVLLYLNSTTGGTQSGTLQIGITREVFKS